MLTLTGVGQPQNGNLISDLLLALCARATYCENKTCSKDTLNEIKNVPFSPYVPVPFTISVKTDNAGTSSTDQFTIPWTGTYNVDWGDGNTDTGVTNAQTHTYATTGTYDVSVTAASGQIAFSNGGDKLKLLDIKNWGDTAWTSMLNAFRGCENMNITATDAPDLSGAIYLINTFWNCKVLDANIDNWDVSTIISFQNAFNGCTIFNSPLNSWNVASATNLYGTFFNCDAFDQDLNNWNTSGVTTFLNTFSGAHSFNGDISTWNVSSGTNYASMFYLCSAFNQDIGGWTIGTGSMATFLYNTPFDQDISGWNVTGITNLTNFLFASGLSTTNYDALLIAWDAQGAMSYSGTVNFGSSQYTLGGAAEAARTSLISKWGSIVDGGGV